MRILIALVTTVFLSVGAYAQDVQKIEQKISNLKDKIAVLEANNQREVIETQYLDPTKVDKNILRLQDKLADLYFELAQTQGRTIDLSDSSSEGIMAFSARSATITPETGDIIVFKPKEDYAEWWAFAGHGWQHAAVFHSSSELVEAYAPNTNSRKIKWSDFIANKPFSMFEKVILVKMNLSSSEQSSMKFYQNEFQVGVPYPSVSWIPFSKYSTDTFYCASLVWAAHKWSGKKVDLDTVASPAMVWPVDLLNSSTSYQHYSVTSW